MKLTVFGANGGVGRELVRQAVERGDTVTAVVRSASTYEVPPGVRVVRVDALTDQDALRPAIAGADAVASAIGPRGRNDGPVAAPATTAIAGAMQAEGVRRIVAVSAAPVGEPPAKDAFLNKRILMPMIGSILRPVYDDLAAMEAVLRSSGLDWTVVRPPKLTDKPGSGAYRTVVGANIDHAYAISRSDTAHAMLAALSDQATVRQPVGIAR